MPRVSTAALQTPVVDVRRVRLTPGPELVPRVARAFQERVASVSPEHFTEADRPVLNVLAAAVVTHADAVAHVEEHGLMLDNGKPNPASKVATDTAKLIASLCTTLRLTPQSRMSADKAATTTRESAPDLGQRAIALAAKLRERGEI